MIKEKLNNWLLISGNGRHVGKTWLSEYCINQLAFDHSVIGLKIASHIHATNKDINWMTGEDNKWMLGEENNAQSNKDSGRMLKAGAKRVFYAQMTNDAFLNPMLEFINNQLKQKHVIVCESAAIGKIIEPGMAFYVYNPNHTSKVCQWSFNYHCFESINSRIINPPKKISWEKNNWIIN